MLAENRSGFEHKPVLLKEVIGFLAPRNGGVYFDGTLGGGGYAESILKASAPSGSVIATDVDDAAVSAATERLSGFGDRAVIVRASYSDIAAISSGRGVKFDGAVLDLGVSSHQLDEPSRGFSFSKEGPLDMRMDTRSGRTAGDILMNSTGRELEGILKEFGEERFARKIAEGIVRARNRRMLLTTRDLEEICYVSYPPKLRRGKTHPATKTFQALRIAVNGELDNLKIFLRDAPLCINDGGRIVIVSYHSLEDRMIKRAFRELLRAGGSKLLTVKPVTPSDAEIENNARARSAKLRAIELWRR